MSKCAAHPERETRYQCLKHEIYLCEECLRCRDPQIYCKHRSACPIHFIEKARRRSPTACVAPEAAAGPAGSPAEAGPSEEG